MIYTEIKCQWIGAAGVNHFIIAHRSRWLQHINHSIQSTRQLTPQSVNQSIMITDIESQQSPHHVSRRRPTIFDGIFAFIRFLLELLLACFLIMFFFYYFKYLNNPHYAIGQGGSVGWQNAYKASLFYILAMFGVTFS